jgi:tetratricopeptide (TPR) repeat protein
MELLKRTVKAAVPVILLMLSLSSNAQDYDKMINAFQVSYISEASGEYNKAIEVLKNVYDEKSYEINLRLGWLSYSSGLFTESMAYYNKAISLMPYSIEARFGIVYPASALGNWTQVLKQYEKILEINPNNSVANHRLGLIYYGREDYLRAESYFEKVVNLYPFDYNGLIMLAWTKYYLKKFQESKLLFYKALMNTPGGSSALEGINKMK